MNTFQRFLLLENGCTVGIFENKLHGKLFFILSRNGEFIFIRQGDQDVVRLTRFISASMEAYVKSMLQFRNRHSTMPYICERFRCSSDEVVHSVKLNLHQEFPEVWASHETQPYSIHVSWNNRTTVTTSSGWKCYISDNLQNLVMLCPTRQRVFTELETYFDTEDVCERGAHGVALEKDFVSMSFSVHSMPSDLHQLMQSIESINSEDIMTTPLLCKRCGADESRRSLDDFDFLKLSIETLVHFHAYPIGATVVCEQVHNADFLWNRRSTGIKMEAWIHAKNSREVVVSLSGDVATVHNSSGLNTHAHLALLQYGGEEIIDDCGASIAQPCHGVLQYRSHIMHMVAMRKTLTSLDPTSDDVTKKTINILPSQCLPQDLGYEEFSLAGCKYSVCNDSSREQIFRGVFTNGFMIRHSLQREVIDVIDAEGLTQRYSVPLVPALTSPELRQSYYKLQSFVKWYNSSKDAREVIKSNYSFGASLASSACIHQVQRDLLVRLMEGSIHPTQGVVEMQAARVKSGDAGRRQRINSSTALSAARMVQDELHRCGALLRSFETN